MTHREEEQPHSNDVQPDERKPLPPGQSLRYGLGTFLAAGALDLVAHFGPTGLVVGGIAAYIAAQHGPELMEQVRGALPARPSHRTPLEEPHTLASESRGGKRSVLDRAFGRFPAREETSLEDTEDADTLIVDEDEYKPDAFSLEWSSQPSWSAAPSIVHPIHLAPDLVLEANDIVGAGINIFGVKGSGKTGAVARLAEQFARYRVSQALFDLKGDLASLVTDRRLDGRPFVPNGVEGGRDQMGRPAINTVFNHGTDKITFNNTPPSRQRALFGESFENTLKSFGYDDAHADAITNILLPDILTYDYSSSAGFLNGRKLTDDVIDISLALVTNGKITTDMVGPHTDYLGEFPFVGNPH